MLTISKDQIGFETDTVLFEVEKGEIKKFAQAIGETNPLYVDEAYAAASKWGALLAPPTFPTVFRDRQRMSIEDLPGTRLHGSQTYTYNKPIQAGMKIACKTVYKDLFVKESKTNRLTFALFEQTGVDVESGEVVFIGVQTSIFRTRSEQLEANA